MVNTILAKRVNHIVAKGGNPVWPKGSKSRGFSTSQPLNILFSGVVNGVPANFSYNLNEKVFRPGYYYHYLGKIDIKEGVVVLDWGSNNWEADVDLNYNESQYKTTGNR